MFNIDQPAEDCKRNPTANTQNNAAFNGSVHDEKIPIRGGEEEKDKTLMLSRELALFINPKQADLAASLIIYGLYTWQTSRRRAFGYNPTINGKPACYRSLRELETEFSWMRHNAILKALRRAEKALKGDFIMQVVKRNGQDQLHFLLSDKLIQTYKFNLSELVSNRDREGNTVSKYWKRRKSGLISFQRNDAIDHGLMGAILIANLKYITADERNANPVVDDAGNIFHELSPTALTKPVEDKSGVVRAPLPVSSDTITRELICLKKDGVFHEHPQLNNFYALVSTMKLLKVDAAEVTTSAAEVTTSAAEVTSKSEVCVCNEHDYSVLQLNFETSDSNRDRNADGKFVITTTASLRSTAAVVSEEISFCERKQFILSLADKARDLIRQRNETIVANYDIRRYAVYDVQDYDEARLIGYELDHEIVTMDWNTGKPYTRESELDNYMAECKMMFASLGFDYKQEDKDKLRELFTDLLWLTPEIIHDHIIHGYLGDLPPAPKKGHDFDYFIRRVKTVKQFLRYLPQLMREKHVNRTNSEWDRHPVTGAPLFDYTEMEEPFFSWLFSDNKIPVGWYYVTVMEEKPEVGYYLQSGINIEFLTKETIMVETTRLKPISYEEWMSKSFEPLAYEDWTYKPGDRRYAEMLSLAVVEEQWQDPVYYGKFAIRDWEKKYGHPEAL